MKKFLFTLLILSSSSFVFSQGTWSPRDTLPHDTNAMIQGLLGFSIGNYGYAGLGSNSAGKNVTDFWQFDPSTNSWSKKAYFPGKARIWPASFVIGEKAYVVCGSIRNGFTCVNECWQYDASSDTWTQEANFPGTARVYAVGFAIDSLGYVGTGANELGDFRKDFYAYHPSTNTWTSIADLPAIARDFGCAFAVNGKGYICGGQDSMFKAQNDLWGYDPVGNIWTQKANYPHPLEDANGFVICDNIYVYGDSTDGFDYYHEFWKYNTLSNSWTRQTDMPGRKRYETMAFSIADSGYSGFGVDSAGQFHNDVYKFYGGDSCQVTTGSNQNVTSIDSYITVFPNPFTDACNILFNNVQVSLLEFSLFDLEGRKMNVSIKQSNSNYILYRGDLKAGIYILSIKTNNQILHQKLTIIN